MRLVRRRTRTAVVVVAAVLTAAGCGSSENEPAAGGPLSWKADPVLTVADNLPDDRILAGTVRNVSLKEELRLDASKVRVTDAKGTKLEAFVLFSHTYAHGLYGQTEAPDGPLGEDRKRLGYLRTVKPGEEAPVTVAYRLTKGTTPPVTIDYGKGRLRVPGTLTEDRGE